MGRYTYDWEACRRVRGSLYRRVCAIPTGRGGRPRQISTRRLTGRSDVSTDAPHSGAYSGADGGGLITSLTVEDTTAARPFDSNSIEPLTIDFAATVGDRTVGGATICRRYVAAGVHTVAVRDRGLAGLLFRPDMSDARPAVLVLGGSEGGLLFAAQTAALLASHGMVSLALAYFRFEQLPQHLVEIPLEYFETALQWLSAQPGVRPDALAVVGRSRGAELALILRIASFVAAIDRRLLSEQRNLERLTRRPARGFAGVDRLGTCDSLCLVVRSDTAAVAGADLRPNAGAPVAPLRHRAGWSARADAFIPVERTQGSMLLISGDDDRMWPSALMGDQIVARLRAHRYSFPFRHCRYPGAGHLMRPPGVPTQRTGRRI